MKRSYPEMISELCSEIYELKKELAAERAKNTTITKLEIDVPDAKTMQISCVEDIPKGLFIYQKDGIPMICLRTFHGNIYDLFGDSVFVRSTTQILHTPIKSAKIVF
jgi:hypothetical protein